MLKIDLYNKKGEKDGQIEVPEVAFGAKVNADLIQQALVRQLANARLGMIAHTKTKGEVSGRNMKPYRQKGTGNARQGSLRNPHQKGGGVALGPRNVKNYNQMMPKKQRRLALFSALSMKFNEGKIMALEAYESNEVKTKNFVSLLHKLPIEKDVLVVLPQKDALVEKSSRNVPFVKTILVNYLNIQDLQKYDHVLFLKEAIEKMDTVFSLGK
jgi:large subunit ribosomal protein L4